MRQTPIVLIRPSGTEIHITANEARSLIESGNYVYSGQKNGKSLLMPSEHRVVFWNGSTDPKNMKIPGEVIS